MKESFQVVVVIPIGPNCVVDFIADTISSVMHYLRSSYKIILADDSQKGTGLLVQQQFPAIEVLITSEPMGKLCGLYITLSLAFRHVLDNYDCKVLLRMDTDALIIGKAPEKEAIELFESQPSMGIAGQYPLDYDGQPWDTSWPAGKLRSLTHTMEFFHRPRTHWILLRRYLVARKKNYRPGESVFGGACFYNPQCLQELHKNGLLPHFGLRKLELEEDHLFSLLVKSIGYELGSLSGAQQPLGCAWQGLPAAPEALEESGKKIIHSTRFWKHMDEKAIRAYFYDKRKAASKSSLSIIHQ